ncbi:hypothetical protein SH1V18_21240 [Vallitalea longa]|uniref:Carboxypeptidase regulatory-like domain-containing protein n=1 Tax=Vallitalea longa TaxID=2936439 RepID=A0A9W6DGE3_9FIRM|nr:carboxypeptidase-like regulatory domain-containing protein [Vallitalea longa]GKX29644.1 hypothetical protein SH1V18_21240 [Vallitalea longa]
MDKYILAQSDVGVITEDFPEIVLNLQLEKNTYYKNSLIYGCITDLCRRPIENANVMFFNKNDKKIGSVYTSKDGRYNYYGVKHKHEARIVIKKLGYKTNISELLEICSKRYRYNVALKKLPISKKALISGHIKDKYNNPVEGIIVYLLTVCCSNSKCIFKTTVSNEYGQFVFSGIPRDEYMVYINDANYTTYNKYIELIDSNRIYNIDVILKPKRSSTRITGQITNSKGKMISNAVVVLYKVEDNKKLIPIKYTTCDEDGRYVFTDIPYSNYIVKAK